MVASESFQVFNGLRGVVPVVVSFAFFMMSGSLFAEIWTLQTGGSNNTGLNGCTWVGSEGNTSTVLNPADDYVAEKDIYISSSDDSLNSFTGKSLRMGTAGGTRRSLWYYGGEAYFHNDGLELASAGIYIRFPNTSNRIHGKISVTASESKPVIIDHIVMDEQNHSEDTLYFAGPLSGDGYLEVEPQGYNNKNYGCIRNLNLSLEGAASEFTGCITLKAFTLRESKYSWSGALCTSGLILPMGDMPASVRVSSKCSLSSSSATNVCSVKSLDLEDGAELKFKVARKTVGENVYLTNDTICVTESFNAKGKVHLKIEHDDYASGTPESVLTLLEVPSSSGISELDFVVSGDFYTKQAVLGFRHDYGRNVKSLVLAMKPIVAMLKKDSSENVQENLGSVAVSDISYWSDSKLPHDDAHYYLKAKVFRSEWAPDASKRLKGLSWSLEKSSFCILSGELELDLLRIVSSDANTLTCQYQTKPTVLKSDVFVDSSNLKLCAYALGELIVDGEISGTGSITCIGNNRGSGNPGGFYEFRGFNTNYAGSVKVSMELFEDRPVSFEEDPRKRFNTLRVSDARNLGGAMQSMDPKGVVLENMSMLDVMENVDFNEPTRGFYIGWIGRISVREGKIMTLRNPLAVNGTMYKESAGRLELGNEAVAFGTSGTDDLPHEDATNHMFIVAGGTVKPLASGCLDGLDVVISNNTSLVFDLSPSNEDLARYGVRNVKTDSPFACAEGTERMTVGFDGIPPGCHVFTNGLFTVKNAGVAASVRQIVSVVKPSGCGTMKLVELTDQETGYVTLAAEFRHHGAVISIR